MFCRGFTVTCVFINYLTESDYTEGYVIEFLPVIAVKNSAAHYGWQSHHLICYDAGIATYNHFVYFFELQ